MWTRTRTTNVITAIAAALIVVGATVALAQGARPDSAQIERGERAPYRSSIQVPDTDDENEREDEDEGDEADERDSDRAERERDSAEGARLQALARITAEQARASALARVPGTAGRVELENEDGNLVYSVHVQTVSGDRDVKVDAGNGSVLHVEQDDDS